MSTSARRRFIFSYLFTLLVKLLVYDFFKIIFRLMRDFKRLQTDPPAGISGAPLENDILMWNCVIFGWVLWLLVCF